MQCSENVPKTPKGRSATVTAESFQFHFPVSPRQMGSGFPVVEARRRLTRFYHCHTGLMRTFAGWIIQIPEFEVKIELGHHLYTHAEAARLLRGRVLELVGPETDLDEVPADWVTLHRELLHAHDPAEFLAATHGVVTRDLLKAEQEYLRATDKLLDLPSIRVLNIIQPDLERAFAWGASAVKAYISGGRNQNQVSQWQSHIEDILRSIGGVFGDSKRCDRPILRQERELQFVRAIGCERDSRFSTFHQTRDYRKADGLNTGSKSEYEADRLDLIRVQRDEIDAIETFANVLFDLSNAEFELQMDLARFIWDESRHAEIGHQELKRLGFEPFDVACGIIGINVRSPLKPEIALAQISIFGELNIVGPMRRLANQALVYGDHQTHVTFDYIHSDEVMHLRRGRSWLPQLHPSGDLKSIEEEARKQACQRLLEEGVIEEDYAMELSCGEIAALIGGE